MADIMVSEKMQRAVQNSDYDAIIAFGPDNIHYLSGATLPFLYHYDSQKMAVIWPKEGTPICLSQAEWASSVRNLSWIRNVQAYEGQDTDSLIDALVKLIHKEFPADLRLGVDMKRIPHGSYRSLQDSLDKSDLVSCDDWLTKLRMIKTAGEIELLEDVAFSTDHAIVAAAHHTLIDSSGQSKSEVGYRHEIQVHAMERYIDLIGHHSVAQVLSGDNSQRFWSQFSKPWLPERGTGWLRTMMEGDLIRAEMRASKNGYWSDAARMLTVGEASRDQKQSYRNLVDLKRSAIEIMKPGTRCNQVFEAVQQEAAEKNIELIDSMGIGHGIGVSTFEPPYLIESDKTELETGMVLILDPIVCGAQKEILRSKDTILINETGCRVLGWYVDWDEPHIPPHLSPRTPTEIVRD